ncbi:MAG: deaminase [Candidatus Nanoarchaeia archaeon]
MPRPSKDEYYLNIALEVAQRATCLRRKYGAVIVNNDRIISTGYAGAPRKTPNCIDLGKCYRQERRISAGQHYELCRSVHAEMNAIVHADYEKMIGGTIYIAGIDLEKEGTPLTKAKPCPLCKRMIINAQLGEVVFREADGSTTKVKVSEWITEANNEPFKDLDEILQSQNK